MKTLTDVIAVLSQHINEDTNVTMDEVKAVRDVLVDFMVQPAAAPVAAPAVVHDFPTTVAESQVTPEEPPSAA